MTHHTLIIHHHQVNHAQQAYLNQHLGKPFKYQSHWRVTSSQPISSALIAMIRNEWHIDANTLSPDFDAKQIKLVISDMDSTLISIECIDEIADKFNIKPEVSAITEAAMRGELNFEQSLTQRVALLKGLDEAALMQVYDERLSLNPGAEIWIAGLKARGIKFALVSGGFDFFTDRLKQRLALDFSRANSLAIDQGVLSGEVLGSIVGAQAKADFLAELCEHLKISPTQVIAIGDGANDLVMMKAAGLSFAYHAKPKVQQEAQCVLNYAGLDAMLDLLT